MNCRKKKWKKEKQHMRVTDGCLLSLQDPAFLEKREHYRYMKDKLSHIKNRIRTFDTTENRGMMR